MFNWQVLSNFLVSAIVVIVVIFVIDLIMKRIPIPQDIKTIAWLIIGLFILFWLLGFGGLSHFC